ncbi:MAG: hypothetical protein CMP26_05935 [Roseibacillus sp.]|nr:hypothetical protein [Roseibacillus sp.]HAO95786.1 hypothetical protein [Verrucomicrobiales bacterium]
MVNQKVSQVLEAEAAFDEFQWDGMEVTAPTFIAEGPDLIRRIEADELKAEVRFGPLLGKRVETDSLRLSRLHVEVDVAKDGPQLEENRRQVVKFEHALIDELSGTVNMGGTALRWSGIRGQLRPGQGRGSYEGALTRGQLLTPLTLFPRLDLEQADLRYTEYGELILKSGSWKVFSSGQLETGGFLDFRVGDFDFEGKLKGVQCDEVVPEDWAKRITGELRSDFTVSGKIGKIPLITGEVQLSNGHLTALPVLDRIASYTSTERFRRLSLRSANLEFMHKGDRLELTNIDIVSEGLLRIEGSLTIDGGQLDGDLRLGLTPSTLSRIPGAAHRVFEPGTDGLHWTPVKISGTTDSPQEDLSDRLIAAGFEWMYEMVNGELVLKSGGKVAGDLGRALWNTGGTAVDIGADILGRGSDILSGVGGQVKPLGDGVNNIIEGILGLPLVPKGGKLPDLPGLPGGSKTPGNDPFDNTPEETERPEPGLPLIRDLGTIPGRALDLLDRGLGGDPAGKRKTEDPENAEEKQSEGSRKTPDAEEKTLPSQPPKK